MYRRKKTLFLWRKNVQLNTRGQRQKKEILGDDGGQGELKSS